MRIFGKSRTRKGSSSKPKRPRVLFVSHEATRTGAPKIILNILKHFHQQCDIQCETLLLSGGHLVEEFRQCSTVDCFSLAYNQHDEIRKKSVKAVNRERNNLPILAVCNSMESRHIAAAIAGQGVPVISLVHELPSSYSEDDYRLIFEASEKVVFPVHTVRDAADAKTPLPQGKCLVLPQGLLDPEFGKSLPIQQARQQLRNEIGIPENAFVVLGCGTLDLRKGIDHFAAVARQVSNRQTDTPIHFVWVGGGPRWIHSIHHYVDLDIRKSAARNRVHFIGERSDVEPYFLGSDTFLMSSRVDPFPCVVHEAMACRIPIITFENNGGAPEAVNHGAGFVVPYADYDKTADTILKLVSEPVLAQKMKNHAYERVQTRYRFESYAEKLIDLGETVIQRSLRKPNEPHSVIRRAA